MTTVRSPFDAVFEYEGISFYRHAHLIAEANAFSITRLVLAMAMATLQSWCVKDVKRYISGLIVNFLFKLGLSLSLPVSVIPPSPKAVFFAFSRGHYRQVF